VVLIGEMKLTLNGTYSNNCCGYCRRHGTSLTVKQLRGRECLKKNCWYLVKYTEHPWWHQREVLKEKKKKRKDDMYGNEKIKVLY
jgi:hypothetical protein